MTHPLYTSAEAQSRETFLALMWALSYPGRIYRLPTTANNFALIAETLLDLETSYFTTVESLQSTLAHTGAKALPVEQASYHFYPTLDENSMEFIQRANMGTMLYPDEAATLIIGCTLGSGLRVTLQGPGVSGHQAFHINGIPEAFWQQRRAACRFPLGWDVYFVDGAQVVGLPRSVSVELG